MQELLRAGRAGEAARRYRGPLLPWSRAPGVPELRRELEGWLRRALLGGENVEALWSYPTTPSGADDLQSGALPRQLPHGDGRRGLAAPRLERLRTTYAQYRRPSVEPAVDDR